MSRRPSTRELANENEEAASAVSAQVASASAQAVSAQVAPATGGTPPARRAFVTARVWIAVVGLLIGAGLVALITLSPSPVDEGHRALVREVLAFLHGLGVPEWFGYGKLEFTANIVLFVPFGFFLALLLPLRLSWVAGVAAMGFSVVIELAQHFLLPARFSTVADVVANTAGGWIGVALAVLLRVCVAARDKRLRADTLRANALTR